MAAQTGNEQATAGSGLLTADEEAVCRQMATGDAPHSQRAMALLALNEGSTRAEAAAKAGLSRGQINYWITKFRKVRVGIFPEPQVEELEAAAEVELVVEIDEAPEPVAAEVEAIALSAQPPKAKKGKKAKKAKKKKEAKKKKKTKKKAVKEGNGKKGKRAKKAKKDKKVKKEKKGQKSKRVKKDKQGGKEKKKKKTKKKAA